MSSFVWPTLNLRHRTLITMIKPYLKSHQERFLAELFDLLRIPSISADSRHKGDVRKAAEFISKKLHDAGADGVEIVETKGHPIVYGEKIVDPTLPTVLVYGHYDVQPPDPLDLWTSPPFEPVIRDGNIYARGACDDKGQVYMHLKAFEAMVKLNLLSCNLKFMIEGEEEVGSDNLGVFVKANKSRLKADVILISDTSLISLKHPSITVGLRGLSYMEVEVIGPNRDLHSGVYGGAVANPVNVLSKMIASLHDKNGRVTIPGFYNDVVAVSAKARKKINQEPFTLASYKRDLGIAEVQGEKGYTTLERTGIRPTLDVNGIWGGYTGEGAKTVLPSRAQAKISMRLVPNQRSKEIAKLFTKHFESLAPKSVKVKVKAHHGGEPAITSTQSPAFKAANDAFVDVWGKVPIPTYEGGSIPIVSLFRKELGLDSVLMGFGLNSDAIHSPNEHYGVRNFLLGIETIVAFHQHFGRTKN
jgi:acetylornithine deacetylase/succinyl-diaminopimelate desuccinylase-like protein